MNLAATKKECLDNVATAHRQGSVECMHTKFLYKESIERITGQLSQFSVLSMVQEQGWAHLLFT
jgi:hypothetical protein